MSMLVGIAVALLIASWYVPNAGRVLATLTLISMLAVLLDTSKPQPPRRGRKARPCAVESPVSRTAAAGFLGVTAGMFVLASYAARRRRERAGIASARVVRR